MKAVVIQEPIAQPDLTPQEADRPLAGARRAARGG